ncbi:hypothetical protein K402DRAFT_389346 [Aulographum hederae CBS 113979]|uniref:Uncharacterized protein n=1 Tax=Aulographum hederae CBS 113979 TaxID=1176131 RepID=A0A6G1HDP8_9PEZI|nr:hypothetical protein K402DRAFT_389346 [Aulographum hederae CBS 113979]
MAEDRSSADKSLADKSLSEKSLDVYVAKLSDANLDIKTKCNFAVELRDCIDVWCHGEGYGQFLEKLVPILLHLLDGQPVFISTSPEQRLRMTVLEILSRLPLPTPEALEPYAGDIVDKLMSLVRTENEDNAVICVKTVMDILRHHTKTLSDRVQPFLDLIQEMFEMMDQSVKDTFDNPTQNPPQAVPGTPSNPQYSASPRPGSPVASIHSLGSVGADIGGEQQQTRVLLKGMQSFKVLAECPIIVVSIFQAYRTIVHKNVKQFVPLIKNVLLLQAKPQEKAHADAKAQGKVFTGVSREIKNRTAFGDFITAQVKTMSFLAYLLRVYAQQLTDFLPTLPDIVIRMLKDCPRERSSTRKELLVAIRHIINFNFRKIFLKKIDELLDERTLLGDGLTVYETMRPLAYSVLADLIHHLRDSLSKEQIRRTIEVYTKNLHDDFPGTSFQTMSAKLLLNMAECIAKLEPKQDARHFLIMILNAIGDKFAAMNRQFNNAKKLSSQYTPPSIDAAAEDYMPNAEQRPDWDGIDIFSATPIKTSNPRERSSDPVADNKFLFKNLLHGLKSMFYQLRACNPTKVKDEIDSTLTPANWHEVSYGFNAEEVQVLIKLFREGAHVFRYYGIDRPQPDGQGPGAGEAIASQQMTTSGKEEKELLETFATVFHHIDPASFHEVFHSEIPRLYDMIFEHPALLHVPQFLLASEATSPSFAGMLLQFLMDKIDEVGCADVKKSSILLKLFKLSFMAVTLFSAQNEPVLLPHVTKLVTKSIQLSTTAEDPMNYFLLLRSLFRSIGGGRFEHLYKEILPLLEMLLEVLNNLLSAARKPSDRNLFVELSLTVPARLSNLLPHLSFLMRPLVVALHADSDLVGQGLRTLELCVDNLTAEYLDPIMAPVIDELMAALWEHLRPNPYSHFHAHTTMRILGKLGGRNRKFLTGPPDLTFKPYTDDQPSVDIRLIGTGKDRAFPIALGIDSAISRLTLVPRTPADKKSDGFYKQKAFNLISTHIKLMVGFDSLPDNFVQLVRLQANDLCAGKTDVGPDLMEMKEPQRSIAKRDDQQALFKKLLKACMTAASVPDVATDASSMLTNLSRHFCILEVGRALAHVKHEKKPFDVKSGEGPIVIDSRVIADAIGESLSSDNVLIREAAEQAIIGMRDAAIAIFGSKEKIDKLPFFLHLASIFTHNCYEEEWFVKTSGALGIQILTTKVGLSDAWLMDRQINLVRALMYVLKDMPQDVTAKTRIQAQETLEHLVRRCNQKTSKEDVTNDKSRIYALCAVLISELAHVNKHVREAAQKTFSILAEVIGVEVRDLLAPQKERLLGPIFNKPLRVMPFGLQISYIDAITYCLKMPDSFVEMNELLTRHVMESLALADAEDEALASKPNEQRNAEAIVNLRVACIRVLSIAQNLSDFGANQSTTRSRIIAVFFKLLYSKSPEVVEAANAGLQGVLGTTQKLPKDLLQSGLRPILMNLQDPRKLTVDGLEGLARLLKLLTNYFKVEIGTRLLDHMKQLGEPMALQKISFTLVEQNRSMKVVTAILNVFHLLPPAAITFLDQLVEKVIHLEASLRRTHFSPFREPLIKYLSQYPKETWDYFSPKVKDHTQGRFFAQILADPVSAPLRKVVVENAEDFIKTFAVDDDAERLRASINAVHITRSICHFPEHRNWLQESSALRDALFSCGKMLETKLRQNTVEPDLRLAVDQAGEQIVEVFTIYLAQDLQNIDVFFDLVDAITSDEMKATPTLFQFIYEHMVSSQDPEYWRTLCTRCIDLFVGRNISQKTKTFAFRYVLNPILAMDIMRNWDIIFSTEKGTKLVDKNFIVLMTEKLWRPQALIDTSDETGHLGVDHARMELLQTSAMLLKYHPRVVQDSRKDLIKFGWKYIKLEDIINKHAGYVVVAFFIANYETPTKLTNQVYHALLQAHQNEGRALVMQALEILAPCLKLRMGGTDTKFPIYARIPKKVLTEESHNLQQLMSVFNFLIKHSDLFYPARDQLALIIIPALQKIAQPPTPSNESKKLALNLIQMVWQWEEEAGNEMDVGTGQSLSPPSKRRADGSIVPPSRSPDRPQPFVANAALRTTLIKYLINFSHALSERFPVSAKVKESSAYQAPQPSQSAETCRKAMRLLYNLLSCWTDVNVDDFLSRYLEKNLTTEHQQEEKLDFWTTKVVNSLQILKVIVNVKPDEWILDHIPQLQKLLEKPVKWDNIEIQECLHGTDDHPKSPKLVSLVRRILDVLPEPTIDEDGSTDDTPQSEFVAYCATVATEALSANMGNHIAAINLLWTLCQRRPTEIDQHLSSLMKVFQSRLCKDHIAAFSQPSGARLPADQASANTDPAELEIQVGLILKTIDILAARINSLQAERRPFLSALASLAERSGNSAVCNKVIDLVETWVFKTTDPVPTMKEKTAVLSKMLMFEQKPDASLLTRFLELVLRIYEDPKITRTELTVRMEHPFLVGTKAPDVDMRNRFLTIFDKHISRTASSRLNYVITSQDWSPLNDTFWLKQVIHLMFGSIEMNAQAQLHPDDFFTIPPSMLFDTYSKDPRISDVMIEDALEDFMNGHRRFCQQIADVKVRDLLEPLGQLQHTDDTVAHDIWVALFPLCWSAYPKDDRSDFEKGLVALMTKEHHVRQAGARPNCIQTLLEGIVRARPRLKFPSHAMKYIAKTYNAWYPAATYMEESANSPIVDTAATRESNLDALVETYALLSEDDLFYGTWRRRASYVETNAALSYEQNGMWDKAQQMYENAQVKARSGALSFSQGEYMLWEDHWVICAQKLQQWEILQEFAKHENFIDLHLEATWRNFEMWDTPEKCEPLDNMIKSVSDAPTPRRVFFQAFMALLKLHKNKEHTPEFARICDEAIQLSIRKWHQLPKRITNAHIPILQNFQNLVELHDASVICNSLAATNPTNLDLKSSELKLLLGTWRDRLPNFWDDISAWQELVTWRQHIFSIINNVYLPYVNQGQNQAGANGNSYAYRGYHETAWIINRFAHVARKHNLPDVCIAQLSKIYTLPNIEIQEAFLKLREQAKCHYQNVAELNSGLDVINNTNLSYFGPTQKAEFYTLKGMFLNKLGNKADANDAFGSALYFDIKLPKAWAEWGRYNDVLFKEDPNDIEKASSAISCYLEAASQFKNAKSRKLLGRILWLLSLDDSEQKLTKTFDAFKGDTPVWYWITYIPQLLVSLSRQEAPIARQILGKLAKMYPQALYFQLRTCREDMHVIRKQQEIKEAKEKAMRAKQASPAGKQSTPDSRPVTANGARPGTADGDNGQTAQNGTLSNANNTPKPDGGEQATPNGSSTSLPVPKKPWEYTEELMSTLKTAFPLLAWSMESMVDQIQKNFKCPPDEDAYRLIVALLNDGISYICRTPHSYGGDVKLPQSTEANITRFAESILPAHIRKSFEADFVTVKPTMREYIEKLRKWRDRFEEKLDRRVTHTNLENMSLHLVEFRFQKFDEVEVPGQYLQHKDKNSDFVRIDRFLPVVDLVRNPGVCHRRLKIRGHDGSIHPFAIQHPAARHSRREERILQLFRIFNGTLMKKKESRRRNLQFHLPLMIPLSPNVRMVQDDASYITLQGVWEDYCRRNEMKKDDPVLFTIDKLRGIRPNDQPQQTSALRLETYFAVQDKYVPNTVALDYFQATYPSFDDFWLFRRTFSYQMASITFLTYLMHISNRWPHKYSISRATGKIWGSELIPTIAQTKPAFHNPDPVLFRFTPNIQTLIGPIATEGIFAPSLMAIARALVEPDGDLEMQLSVFVRDEVIYWGTQAHKVGSVLDGQLRDNVQANTDLLRKRAVTLASPPDVQALPANQTVVDLIGTATDPRKLAFTEPLWMGYL